MFLFQQSSFPSKTLLSLNRSPQVLLFCDLQSKVDSLQRKTAGTVIIYWNDQKYSVPRYHTLKAAFITILASNQITTSITTPIWKDQRSTTPYKCGLINNFSRESSLSLVLFNNCTKILPLYLSRFFLAPWNHFYWELCGSNCAKKKRQGRLIKLWLDC